MRQLFRFYKTHLTTNVINLLGMVIGFTAFLLVALYINYETSYDSFFEESERIYKMESYLDQGSGSYTHIGAVPVPLGPEYQGDFPEVESIVRFIGAREWVMKNGDRFLESDLMFYADSNVFDVFNYQFIEGEASAGMLDAPFEVVITQKLARKLFGREPALGKSIERNTHLYTVTGVIEDLPQNTNLEFEGLISMTSPYWVLEHYTRNWHAYFGITYVKLLPRANPKLLSKKLTQLALDNRNKDHLNETAKLTLHPIGRLHNYALDKTTPELTRLSPILKLLILLGVLIWLITVVNYTNISVAQLLEQKRYFGIIKVNGGKNWQVYTDYLKHAGFRYMLGVTLAILLVFLTLPAINNLFHLGISLSAVNTRHWIVAGLGVVLVFALVSVYPLRVISRIDTFSALKETKPKIGGVNARRVLIAAQFFITFILVSTTIIVVKQSRFLINEEIGIQTNNILVIKTDQLGSATESMQVFKQELQRMAETKAVTLTNALPGSSLYLDNYCMPGNCEDSKFFMKDICADADYVEALDLEIVAGTNFDEHNASEYDILLTESAIRTIGYTEPNDAVGEFVYKDAMRHNYRIVGVVKDFLFTFHDRNDLATLRYSGKENRFTVVHYADNQHYEMLQKVNEKWGAMFPDTPFRFFFLDENYEQRYSVDLIKAKATVIFSIIAVILAAIGLFAISYFTILKREKEFGIRKINGASVREVSTLVYSDFSKMILVVCVLAIPLAYWIARQLLAEYNYRIDLHWWIFSLPVVLILIISMLSITYHVLKLALINPIHVLKE